MNDSEKRRVKSLIANFKSKPKGWTMVFGRRIYTADQLIKELGNNKSVTNVLLDYLDKLVISELDNDAARGKQLGSRH